MYRDDAVLTGELGTYISRDSDGRSLYLTHHFDEEEVRALLAESGFSDICVEARVESSSRRPDQAARFLYATARVSASG